MAEAFGVTSAAAGLISLGITLCQGILNYYGSWKDAENDVRRMYAATEALTKTFILLKLSTENQKFNRDIVARVNESIDSCEGGINDLKKKLKKVETTSLDNGWSGKAKAQFRRTLYPFKESTLVKLKEITGELQDRLVLAMNVLQIDASAASLQTLGSLKERLDHVCSGVGTLVSVHQDEHLLKVYNWLSPLSGEFEAKQLDTFNLKGRQDGIGSWLVGTNEFKDWLNGTGKILWCRGSPGVGKTVLASFIIDFLQQKFAKTDVGIAFVYCNYKEASMQTPTNIVANLLRQLVYSQPAIPDELKALYESHLRNGTRPSLGEYSKLLQTAVEGFSRVLIVIDALDEYPVAEGARDTLLAEIRKLQPRACLLVTSRDIPKIERGLQGACPLEIQASDEDMKGYLKECISSSSDLMGFTKEDRELQDAIMTTIVKKAQGMFLLARLHLDSLTAMTSRRDVKEALKSLPEGVYDTYDKAIERINSQNSSHVALATKVLSWIICAVRPLTVDEMLHALAVYPDDKFLDKDGIRSTDILVSVCAGIVTIQQESNTISLVHYTAQEYFGRENKRPEFLAHAQAEIARTCLTYLSFDDFETGPCSSDREMEARLQKYPLLPYAARYWGIHARMAPEHTITGTALKFLESKSRISCSIQVIHIPKYRYRGYSEDFPRAILGLWIGSYFGLEQIVRLLLENGADVEAKDSYGRTALQIAVEEGHGQIVQRLLEKGPDVNAHGGYYGNALQAASAKGHDQIVQRLLENGADVNAQGGHYGNALCAASVNGHGQIVQQLLEKGADVNAQGGDYGNALYAASAKGHDQIVQRLLENGTNVNAQGGRYGNALQAASAKGHSQIVQRLLENGADANGHHALYVASANGHDQVVQRLLENGADVNAQDDNALYAASANGHDQIVQRLFENGADANAQGEGFGNALCAASAKGHDQIVQRLLEKGADVNAQGGYYDNALQAASANGHGQIVQQLLEKGAGVRGYGNALCAALANGYDQIVQQLLEKGADVNAQGEDYDNALYVASANGHDQIVQQLLEKGADANAQGGYYGNALCAASAKGHDQIVQRLLEKGADVNAQGGYYDNALQAASANGHGQIVQQLLEKGAGVRGYGNALCAALANGYDQIVQQLLEKGADVNAQGVDYGNALYAASAKGHGRIVQQLLEKGADVNAQGGYYGNALQVASVNGHNQVVQWLLEKGADVNAQGEREYGNALCAASANGHDQIVQWLLEKGADVNAQGGCYDNALQEDSDNGHDQWLSKALIRLAGGQDFGNALCAASALGHDQIVQRLLEKGADVNAQDGYYGNALCAASAIGHDQIVQRLLEKGADVNAQGGPYGNALQAASANGYNQIVQVLLEKGADVNAQGGNALQAASAGGHDQIVQRLLEKGADVNTQGGYYGNAL